MMSCMQSQMPFGMLGSKGHMTVSGPIVITMTGAAWLQVPFIVLPNDVISRPFVH